VELSECKVRPQDSFMSVLGICKLYGRTVRSAWSQHHHWLCVSTNSIWILFERSLLIKITLISCRLIRLLKFDSGGSNRKGCGRDSSRQLVRNKGTKWITWLRPYWWTIMDTILTDWWLSTDYYNCLFLSLIFINDTLSDIKGKFDVVITIVVHTSYFRISLINIFIFSYEYCLVICHRF